MNNLFRISGVILLIFLIHSCTEKPTPPVITTTAVTAITYTTATSGGDATNEGGAPIVSRGVCWNTSADPTIANSITIESGGLGTFTSNLTQLTPNTMYYVKAYATNSAGTGYGNQVSFTTLQVAVPVLTTTAVTSIAQTSAVSGGNITSDNGGSVTVRGVCWGTAINPTTTDNKTTDGTGTGSFVSNLIGLQPGTIYYVRSYATNSVGTAYGNEISFTTSSVDTTVPVTYSLSDMLGTWQRHSLVTSSSNNGFWIHGSIINSGVSSTVHVILPNGTYDTIYTSLNGSISSTGVLTISDDPAAHSYMSTDKNLIVRTTKRSGLYTLVMDQKAVSGTIYSTTDLQGTWQTHYLVGGGSWSGWVHGKSTIDNNGNSTLDNVVKSDNSTGASTVQVSISSSGVISVYGVNAYNGFMSADKKLMITNMTDGGGGGGLAISQKVVAETNYSTTDMQGTWQMHDILVGSENWTEHGIMTIDANGNGVISNMIKDNGGTFNNPGTIRLSISLEGIVTFGTDLHGFVSADKKLIFCTQGDDAGHAYSLVVLQKMP